MTTITLLWFITVLFINLVLFHLSILGEYPRLLTERGWFETNRWSHFADVGTAIVSTLSAYIEDDSSMASEAFCRGIV